MNTTHDKKKRGGGEEKRKGYEKEMFKKVTIFVVI